MDYENHEQRIAELETMFKLLFETMPQILEGCRLLNGITRDQSEAIIGIKNQQLAVLKLFAVSPWVPGEQKQVFLKEIAHLETVGEKLEWMMRELKSKLPPSTPPGNPPPAPPGS